MAQASEVVRGRGLVVKSGTDYVGQIVLQDPMHFAVESTPLVVEMYYETLIIELPETCSVATEVLPLSQPVGNIPCSLTHCLESLRRRIECFREGHTGS